MCSAIALKLCTWLYNYGLQTKFEDSCYRPILVELCSLRDFMVFRTFFLSAYKYSFDMWYNTLPYQDTDQVWVWFWSIDFSRSYMAVILRKKSRIINFTHFFLVFIWYLVHCFAIPQYRLSLSLAVIHWFFPILWPLDVGKNPRIISFSHFFFALLTYILLIFGSLLCISRYRFGVSLALINRFFTKLLPLDRKKITSY
jgi:hypothetical protein